MSKATTPSELPATAQAARWQDYVLLLKPRVMSLVVFLVVLVEAAVRRRPARANPWGAGATTLEWTLPSPPPFHQFNELPVIHADSH